MSSISHNHSRASSPSTTSLENGGGGTGIGTRTKTRSTSTSEEAEDVRMANARSHRSLGVMGGLYGFSRYLRYSLFHPSQADTSNSSSTGNGSSNGSSINHSMATDTANATTHTILSKLLYLWTLLIRLLLFPLRLIVSILNGTGTGTGMEFQLFHGPHSGDEAAKHFVKYVRDNCDPLLYHHLPQDVLTNFGGVSTSTSTSASASHGTACWECPFVDTSYMENVSNISSLAANFETFDDTAAAADTDINHSLAGSDGTHVTPSPTTPPLLLVYIHSHLHPSCEQFLQNILLHTHPNHPNTIQSLLTRSIQNGTLRCWGGSTRSAEAIKVGKTLHLTSYPFLAMVRIQPGPSHTTSSSSTTTTNTTNSNTPNTNPNPTPNHSRNQQSQPQPQQSQPQPQVKMELKLRLEGRHLLQLTQTQLQSHIATTLNEHEQMLTEQTTRRMHRFQERRLRMEQDREYQEALLEDQRREQERQKQQQIEEQQRMEEETKAKRQREELDRKERDRQHALDTARQLASNAPGEDAPRDRITVLRFVLPSGKKVARKFWREDRVEHARAFLVSLLQENKGTLEHFGLSSRFPVRNLEEEELGDKTLGELGLCPSAVIMVQDLDA